MKILKDSYGLRLQVLSNEKTAFFHHKVSAGNLKDIVLGKPYENILEILHFFLIPSSGSHKTLLGRTSSGHRKGFE